MDDSFVSQRPEVEVYWDCQSPTPAVWKKHQRPASTEKPKYSAQDVRSSKFTTSYPNHFLQAQKALSANNDVDGNFLAIAKQMVEKLRESESGGVSTHTQNENVCSMDAVFDMSGQNEQLVSLESDITTTTVTVPNTSSLSTSIDLTNVNIDCNWGEDDDDLFNNIDDGIEKQPPFQAYASRKSPLHFTTAVKRSNVSSSTPLRRSSIDCPQDQRSTSSSSHKMARMGNENCSNFFLPTEKEKVKSAFSLRVKRTPSPHRTNLTKKESVSAMLTSPKRSEMNHKVGQKVASNKDDAVWGDSITDDVLADFMLEDSWDEFVSDDNSASTCNSEKSKRHTVTTCCNQTIDSSSSQSFTRVTASINTRSALVSSVSCKNITVPSTKNSIQLVSSACTSSSSSSTGPRASSFRKSTTSVVSHQMNISSKTLSTVTHLKTVSKNNAHRSLFPTNNNIHKGNMRKTEPLKTVQEKDGFFSDDDDLLKVYDQFQSSQESLASNVNQLRQPKIVTTKSSTNISTKLKPNINKSSDVNGPENKKARCSPDEIARKRQLALEKLKKRKAKTSSSRKTILF